MAMRKLIPTLMADNMDRTIAFYRDLLGFQLYEVAPDQSPYTWAVLRCDGVDLSIEARSSFLEEKEWVFLEGAPLGGTIVLYIEIEGIDELYQRIRNQVDVVSPLAAQPYGMREFTLRDCNGYVLAFGERL